MMGAGSTVVTSGRLGLLLLVLLLQQQACLQTLAQIPPAWMGMPPWMEEQPWMPPSQNTNLSSICDNVDCGKGKCVVQESNHSSSSNGSGYSYSYSYSYGCECESGWNSHSSGHHHKFLPCVLPNCSFSTSCPQTFMEEKPKFEDLPSNPSDMNACLWAICGEGTCKNTSSFSYICECNDGYSNLANISSLPCYKGCKGGIGEECEALGIGTPGASVATGPEGSTPSPSPSPAQAPLLQSEGSVRATPPAKLLGLLVTMMGFLFLLTV